MFEKFTKGAKVAVVLAQEEAKELGAQRIGPEHVLLGVLTNAEPPLRAVLDADGITAEGVRSTLAARANETPLGADDAEALRSIGVDLDAVRASVIENFGPQAWDQAEPEPKRGIFGRVKGTNWGHIPFSAPAKKSLELALREALRRKDREIGTAHLLLGILRSVDPAQADLLGGSDGIATLREDIHRMLDRAA
ncbi:Clp protease N-terminal domain-containing protein [Nocardia sp. NPDC023988]|uniref:Clp protease N-terminal domain-containing protein n=1 Tax=unclassified Nocardia TaxID=2637762 RepID=UPI0033C5C554